MSKCDFNKVALHFRRTLSYKNTYGGLLLTGKIRHTNTLLIQNMSNVFSLKLLITQTTCEVLISIT